MLASINVTFFEKIQHKEIHDQQMTECQNIATWNMLAK